MWWLIDQPKKCVINTRVAVDLYHTTSYVATTATWHSLSQERERRERRKDHHLWFVRLHAIGWFRCNGCNELLFTQPNLTTHNASCQAHQLLERRHKYNNLIQRCPPNHLTELETMIDTNVDGQLITQTFIEWLMEPTIDNLDLF